MTEKELAARRALDFVRDGMTVGLGTGSTASLFVRALGERRLPGLRGVATSEATAALAREVGIPLVDLNDVATIDVTVDGADEIAPGLELIKGGGGALLREKLVARASREYVIIADASKEVAQLGRFPLPVEVIPFSWRHVERELAAMGLEPRRRGDLSTDQGNMILDLHFGMIPNPGWLAATLKAMPGVVEHGLFLGMATVAIVAQGDHTRVRRI